MANQVGRVIAVGLLAAGLIGGVAFGLSQPQQPESPRALRLPPEPPAGEKRNPSPAPVAAPSAAPAAEPHRDEPALRLTWTGPAETRVNRPGTYALNVTNTSPQALQKVVVQVRVPNGVVASDTDPPARTVGGVLMWELGTLQPGDGKELKLTLSSPARGDLTAQAWVTFTGTSSMTVAVREPKLEAFIQVPETVAIGESIPVKYGSRSTGDTQADNVVVKLATVRSWDRSQRSVFTDNPPGGTGEPLAPGQVKTSELHIPATAGGVVTCDVNVTGADGLKSVARAQVKVLAPRLEVSLTGPAELGITRSGKYTLKLANVGDLAADGVTAVITPADGIRLRLAAPRTGSEPGTSKLPVDVGSLKPGESREVVLDGTALKPGECLHQVAAIEKHGIVAAGECRTVVKGVPGIRMEVMDTVDPVEKGQETVYEVKVSNTGTETDRNLKLVCVLPPGMRLVSASGPVEYLSRVGVDFNAPGPQKNTETVEFAPVRELGPKTEVVFKVKVKAGPAGDARFKATITSDHLTTPVSREESTTVYGE